MPRSSGLLRTTLRPILFVVLFLLPGLPLIGATGIFIGHNVASARRARAAVSAAAPPATSTAPVLPAEGGGRASLIGEAHGPAARRGVARAPRRADSLSRKRALMVRQAAYDNMGPRAFRPSSPAREVRGPGAASAHARADGLLLGIHLDALARAGVNAHRLPLYLWSIPVAYGGHGSGRVSGMPGAVAVGRPPHGAVAARAPGSPRGASSRTPRPEFVHARRHETRVRHVARRGTAVPPPAPSDTLPTPPVFARAAYLYDVTNGRALYAKDAEAGLPMASTTKIMTALLAITYGHLDDVVTASPAAAAIGESTMYLRQGEQLTLRDLLYGLMLPSGNDAAVAIAEHVGGSTPAFVAMMNREAALLGMTHTHFATPHGLDAAGHYASAHDMALLALAAMRLPAFRQIVATRSYTIPATAHNDAHYLNNINQPLWWYPGVIGLKPGSTGAAGRCAVEWVVRGGHALLLVLLGGGNLVTDVRDLFNWGFGDFSRWYSPTLVPVYYAPEYLGWDGPALWLPTVDGGRYYARSGHTVRGPLLARYLASGGFARYGAPTSEGYLDGHGVWRQRFAASWLFYNPRTRLSAPTERAVQ